MPEEIIKQGSFDLIHPEDRPSAEAILRSLGSSRECASFEVRIRNRRGEYIWVDSNLRVARDPKTGTPTGILNIVRDTSKRRQSEQVREFHYSLMRAIYGVTLDGILVVNDKGDVSAINKRFSEVWQVPELKTKIDALNVKEHITDRQVLERCVDQTKDPKAFLQRIQELYADPDAEDSCHIEMKNGTTLERYSTGLRSDSGQYLGRVWFFRDITDRVQAEQRLQEAYRAVEVLAVTDALTGLANRRQFDLCLATEWRRGLRDCNPLSLLLIDVDQFKAYNDNYGHLRGDSCLKQIAEAAQGAVARSGDLVARFGGEEHAVVLPGTMAQGANDIGNAVAEAIRSRQLTHKGTLLGIVTVSIGCATLVPQLGQNSASLIELVDRALYIAKRNGRNRVCTAGLGNCASEERTAMGIGAAIKGKAS